MKHIFLFIIWRSFQKQPLNPKKDTKFVYIYVQYGDCKLRVKVRGIIHTVLTQAQILLHPKNITGLWQSVPTSFPDSGESKLADLFSDKKLSLEVSSWNPGKSSLSLGALKMWATSLGTCFWFKTIQKIWVTHTNLTRKFKLATVQLIFIFLCKCKSVSQNVLCVNCILFSSTLGKFCRLL